MSSNKAKVYAWDLETSDLRADWGWIICAAVKDVNTGELWTYRIDDQKGFAKKRDLAIYDKQLVSDLQERLGEADLWVTHYGSRFDEPMLRSRALYHRLPTMPPVAHLDMWRVARQHLLLTSNRQGSVNDFLKVEHPKYHLDRHEHQLARLGVKDAIDKMLVYNVNDVEGLADNYKTALPVIRNHPYIAKAFSVEDPDSVCPSCGGQKTQKRGIRRTKLQVIERRNCVDCGSWYDGKKTRAQSWRG